MKLLDRHVPPTRKGSLPPHDIYHSSFGALPPASQRVCGAKHFLTVYDLIPIMFPQWYDAAYVALVTDVTNSIGPEDYALCISESVKRDLCGYGSIDPARVVVTELAADSDMFFPVENRDEIDRVRRRYGIPPGNYVLSVNTLTPRKNIDHAVRAFSKLVEEERISDLSLVLVGANGWRADQIHDAVSGLGRAAKRIITTGYVEDADLAPLYSGAICFVYPSLYEGFGLPVLEAMQCGVPVIAANTSSLPEVAGDAGILVDPTDEAQLCQELLQLYRDEAARASLAQKSRERAASFTWTRCVQKTVAAYRNALR